MLKTYGTPIEDGIANLGKALQLDPDYAGAMTCTHLLLRDRAMLRDAQADADEDLAAASRWSAKASELRPPRNPETIPIAPPPPPPGQVRSASREVVIGGRVAEANLIRKVEPVYPTAAKAIGVQGVVRFTAHIGANGTVSRLELVSGHPLLVNAAREAVLQWGYRPVLLSGQPVAVVTDIVVNFTFAP